MFSISVNGEQHTVDVPGDKPLLWVLRDELKLTGTKYGCGRAMCGACTVYIDGEPARSCVTPVKALDPSHSKAGGPRQVTTIEAISSDAIGQQVQAAWDTLNVPQCGYCQSGQVMAATALLHQIAHPTDRDIDEAMSGNLCRCGTYPRIRKAIHSVASGDRDNP